MAEKDDKYTKFIADMLIEAIDKGVAPWEKEWSAQDLSLLAPYNPETRTHYQGGNELALILKSAVAGYRDNRWMTYNQAKSCGGQVKAGEKGVPVKVVITKKEVDVLDEFGKPVLDEEGNQVKEVIYYDKPKIFPFTLFNVSQINFPDGHQYSKPLDVQITKEQEWENIQAAENLINNTGAKIYYDGGNTAFYRPSTDSIHLPVREAFRTQEGFYSTALHELSHWTGHDSRLARPLTGGFGTKDYAKEELVAEISSFMLCLNLGIGHNLEKHASYVESWLEVLRKDPKEVYIAAKKATEAQKYVNSFTQKIVVEETKNITYLNVPHDEQSIHDVMSLGAFYDLENSKWYITETHDKLLFKDYLSNNILTERENLKIKSHKDLINESISIISKASKHIFEINKDEQITEQDVKYYQEEINQLLQSSSQLKKLLERIPEEKVEAVIDISESFDKRDEIQKLEQDKIFQELEPKFEEKKAFFEKYRENGFNENTKEKVSLDNISQTDVELPKEKEEIKFADKDILIDVPYKEKNEAKKLGAKWDKDQKCWYIPKGEDIAKFDKWHKVESKKTVNIKDLKKELNLNEKQVSNSLKTEQIKTFRK